MRVLTLSTLFPDQSRPNFGVFVERQTLGLDARPGVEVTVVAPVGLPPFPLSFGPRHRALRALPAFETWRGLPVHRPRFTSLPPVRRLNPGAVSRAVLPLARRLRPDVIDAEFFWPDGPAAAILSRKLGIPFSIKARGSDIQLWGLAHDTAGQVVDAGRAAGGLLAVSEALREVMIGLGLPGERIAVHRTGIDRTRFHPRPREAAKAKLGVDGPLLLCVGALVPRKRTDLAIASMAHLPGATLLIAGAGPERAALSRQIATLGLQERVRLLGPVPHADLPPLFAAADILLHLSESEGLANVWVEALASGTPVLAADAGGAGEVIRSPAAGAIVPPEPTAIAAAAQRLLAAPPTPETVAATVEAYSWERNAEELEAHLRRIVGGTPTQGGTGEAARLRMDY